MNNYSTVITDDDMMNKNTYLQSIQQHNDASFTLPEQKKTGHNTTDTSALHQEIKLFTDHAIELLDAQERQMNQDCQTLMNKLTFIAEQCVKSEDTHTLSDEFKYLNLDEVTHLQTYFAQFNPQDPRIADLLSHLPLPSYRCVINILKQTEQLFSASAQQITEGLSIYSAQECPFIEDLQRSFTPYILHINPTYHQYQHYILPTDQFSSLLFYFNYGLSELSQLPSVQGKTIIDIGSTAGDSALIFQQLHPSAVYLFEDDPIQTALIHQTLTLNQIMNTYIMNPADTAAASDTIDAYIEAAHIDHIGLLKINLSTSIIPVLQGASNTLSLYKPILIIHIDHDWNDFLEIKPFIESLHLGYQCQIYKPLNGYIVKDTILIAEIK